MREYAPAGPPGRTRDRRMVMKRAELGGAVIRAIGARLARIVLRRVWSSISENLVR